MGKLLDNTSAYYWCRYNSSMAHLSLPVHHFHNVLINNSSLYLWANEIGYKYGRALNGGGKKEKFKFKFNSFANQSIKIILPEWMSGKNEMTRINVAINGDIELNFI